MSATRLKGSLAVPADAVGAILVAVRSSEQRNEPAGAGTADFLHYFGFASLIIALEGEHESKGLGVERLAGRLADAVQWLDTRNDLRLLPFGILALGDAVAPALVASAHLADRVSAMVVGGGRPDLAGPALSMVSAPTLLVVGAEGGVALGGARSAARSLSSAEVAVIDDVNDLLTDPGALGTLAWLARRWFTDHLAAQPN